MAEGAFRLAAGNAGMDVAIDSAGTGAWHVGNPPDPRAQQTALSHGVDISGLKARQIQLADYTQFTHIFALDEDNLATIEARAPEAGFSASISLLLDLVPGMEGRPVADPYYGQMDGFERSWKEVSAAADALVYHLRR